MRRNRLSTESSLSTTSPGTSPSERSKHDRISPLSSSPVNKLNEVPDFHKTYQQRSLRERRTSLPVSTNPLSLRPTSNISEARGLVVDMLASKDLPPNVASCLRVVASLLVQHNPAHSLNLVELGLPRIVENPFSGERLVVSTRSTSPEGGDFDMHISERKSVTEINVTKEHLRTLSLSLVGAPVRGQKADS